MNSKVLYRKRRIMTNADFWLNQWLFENFRTRFKKEFPEIANKYFENEESLQATIDWFTSLLSDYVYAKIDEYMDEHKRGTD